MEMEHFDRQKTLRHSKTKMSQELQHKPHSLPSRWCKRRPSFQFFIAFFVNMFGFFCYRFLLSLPVQATAELSPQ